MFLKYIITIFLFLSLFWITPQPVSAGELCNWSYVARGAQQICLGNHNIISATTKCEYRNKPALPQFGNGTFICCCRDTSAFPLLADDTNKAKFIIPELQIKIPGLNLTTTESNSLPWIAEYVIFMYTYGFNTAIIIAALVMMAGGMLWLSSGGNQSRITKAKEIITGGIFGLILIAAAYVLLAQINPDLINFKPISPPGISSKEIDKKQVTVPDINLLSNNNCVVQLEDDESPWGTTNTSFTGSPLGQPNGVAGGINNGCSLVPDGYKKNGFYWAGIADNNPKVTMQFALTKPDQNPNSHIYCPAANKNVGVDFWWDLFTLSNTDPKLREAEKQDRKAKIVREIQKIAYSYITADQGPEVTSYNCFSPNNGKYGSYGTGVRECGEKNSKPITSKRKVQLFDCGGWVAYVYSCAGLAIPVASSNETTFDIALHQPENTGATVLGKKGDGPSMVNSLHKVKPGDFFGVSVVHAMLMYDNGRFAECGGNQKSNNTSCVKLTPISEFKKRYNSGQYWSSTYNKMLPSTLITFPLDYIIDQTEKNFFTVN